MIFYDCCISRCWNILGYRNFVVGDGRDAPAPHCAVPGIVLPARVDTSYAGDGATGQQPR